MASVLKKTDIELELLTDYDMLLMVEKGIRGGICHSIQRYAKANNKYMKNYNNNEESSYIQYLDANNLYGWAMSKKLPTNGFKWIDNNETAKHVINEDFIKKYNESNGKGYILEVDVKYPKRLHELHSDLPFLSERMEVNKSKKLVCNLFNKKKYVVHINALKQALNHGLKLKKIHRVIEFNQEAWLKPYIDMNTELRKAAKNDFEKDLFKLMNNSVFGKTMVISSMIIITSKKYSKTSMIIITSKKYSKTSMIIITSKKYSKTSMIIITSKKYSKTSMIIITSKKYSKTSMIIITSKKYSKTSMIIITSKKYSKTSMIIIDDNNYIENI